MNEYIIRETGYPGAVKQEIVGELVRCKECKYSDECHKSVQYTRRESPTTMTLGSVSVEYCSRGKRKDDADE